MGTLTLEATGMRLSTITAICTTNATVTNLAAAFEGLTPSIVSGIEVAKFNQVIKTADASSVCISQCKKKGFRNAITLCVRVDPTKLVNVKVCTSGKMQLTGCKSMDQAIDAVKKIYDTYPNLFQCPENHAFTAQIYPVMTNYDLRIGFLINRTKLDEILSRQPSMSSMVEISYGYPGVICKQPIEQGAQVGVHVLSKTGGQWTNEKTTQAVTGGKTTLMVFQTGAVIASGQCVETILPHVQKFMHTIEEHRQAIQLT